MEWDCGPVHDRVTIFVGMSGQTLSNCGTLTFRLGESARFRKTVGFGIQFPGFEGILQSGWKECEKCFGTGMDDAKFECQQCVGHGWVKT